jgi:hypothetical protein
MHASFLRAYAGRESEVQDEVLMGRAQACLRWTSQTTCGDGAAMERWSTRALWRAVRREAEVCEFADRWAWSGQAFAHLQLWARWASAGSTPAARLASRTGGGDED